MKSTGAVGPVRNPIPSCQQLRNYSLKSPPIYQRSENIPKITKKKRLQWSPARCQQYIMSMRLDQKDHRRGQTLVENIPLSSVCMMLFMELSPPSTNQNI